jgi:hypothetical protein
MPYKSKYFSYIYYRARFLERSNYVLELKKLKRCYFCEYSEHPEILEFIHPNITSNNFRKMWISCSKNKFKKLFKNIKLICPNCERFQYITKIKKLNGDLK